MLPGTVDVDDVQVAPLDRRTIVPAVGVVALLLAFSARYGFHRDELYFIESARHAAWGYVDNPSLTPMVGWLSQRIFGDSLFGLRVLPAIEVGALVVVVAATARELGAAARAQLLAAVLTATASFVLGVGHLLTTPTLDLLITSLVLLGLCRIVRTGEPRWWLLVGLGIGVGLENKSTLIASLGSLGLAAVVTGGWRRLVSRWMWVGAAIALVVALPQLLWQIDHGWPQIEFARALATEDGAENRATLLPFQLLILGPPLAPILVAGVWSLWRRPAWRNVRFLGIAYVVLLVVLLVTGGKGYYAASLFGPLIAAGAIATVDWVERGSSATRRTMLGTGLVLNFVVGAIIVLPVLPQRLAGPLAAVNPDAVETIGWPAYVDQVAAVVHRAEDAYGVTPTIIGGDYGMAGAIDRYGPRRGIGPAYSPHNSYADFREPSGDGPVVVIGYGQLRSRGWFTACLQDAMIHTVDDIENEVDGAPVWVCDGPARPWPEVWSEMRRYG